MTDDSPKDPAVEAVASVLDAATPVEARHLSVVQGGGGASTPAAPPKAQGGGLPDDCPVVPLGVKGDVSFYLDANRQMIALKPRDHGRAGIVQLFGVHKDLLYKHWPRKKVVNDEEIVTGWKPELIAELLQAESASAGVWDPTEKVRGRGAWRGQEGELVLHLGDQVLIGHPPPAEGRFGKWHKPGFAQGQVYPAGAPLHRPAEAPAPAGDAGPGAEILALLRTWNWERGALDARLLLGWIAAAMIAGALKWRPACWITGGRGTGKSTLHDVIGYLLGEGLVSVADGSPAGIWQKLRHDSLPVALDELEAEEDGRKAQALVKLARAAASGAMILRGGSDHQATSFVARSAFLFSSILIPPLQGQDRSRLAILELGELGGAPAPKLDGGMLRELGRALLRRMFDGWHRFDQTLERWRAELTAAGHNARGADQFGTLLTAADLALYDAPPDSDSIAEIVETLKASSLSEIDDDVRDEFRARDHLLSQVIDPWKSGERRTLAEWIDRANRTIKTVQDEEDRDQAQRILAIYGIRVLWLDAKAFVAIANQHSGLAALFERTHWAGRSGTSGVWMQAFRRLPGAERSKGAVRFGAFTARATLVPVETMLPEVEG